MIIDCHGHFTTAPRALGEWRERQIRAFEESGARVSPDELRIGDDEIRAAIENGQLKLQRERGTDLAVRLGYAGVEHTLVHDTVAGIKSCPPGRVEVVANYTAFLALQRALARHG